MQTIQYDPQKHTREVVHLLALGEEANSIIVQVWHEDFNLVGSSMATHVRESERPEQAVIRGAIDDNVNGYLATPPRLFLSVELCEDRVELREGSKTKLVHAYVATVRKELYSTDIAFRHLHNFTHRKGHGVSVGMLHFDMLSSIPSVARPSITFWSLVHRPEFKDYVAFLQQKPIASLDF